MSVMMVMVVMMVRFRLLVFLSKGRRRGVGMGGAQTFALLLSLLKNSFVGQRTKPTEELPINLNRKKCRS